MAPCIPLKSQERLGYFLLWGHSEFDENKHEMCVFIYQMDFLETWFTAACIGCFLENSALVLSCVQHGNQFLSQHKQ